MGLLNCLSSIRNLAYYLPILMLAKWRGKPRGTHWIVQTQFLTPNMNWKRSKVLAVQATV